MKGVNIKEIRRALADYMFSEGCSCCQNEKKHKHAAERLALLLDVPAYSDHSGYDFFKFKTKD